MYTGRRYDAETGNYYYRARYYSPELGRFLSPDPLGLSAGLNLYGYVTNNPLNWIDPWGLCKELSREEFEEIMGPHLKKVLEERSRLGGILPWNYYNEGADSDFHYYNSETEFCYQGQKYKGEYINYYLQGILHHHYHHTPRTSLLLVRLNNFRHLHDADPNEYIWTMFGYEEYDSWVEWLKKQNQ